MQSVSLGGNPRDASFERTLDIIEVIADAAYRRLPHKFRALCEDLVIRVEDFPSDEVLDQLGAQTEFDLLGLFQGVGLVYGCARAGP